MFHAALNTDLVEAPSVDIREGVPARSVLDLLLTTCRSVANIVKVVSFASRIPRERHGISILLLAREAWTARGAKVHVAILILRRRTPLQT